LQKSLSGVARADRQRSLATVIDCIGH
jgi:hypothetical protein